MRSTAKHLRCELVLFILLLAGVASAQTYTATVTGTISDPNGQPVPNVKVTATNKATNIATTAQTGDSGNFTIPFLPPGQYDIAAESTGFKRTVQNDITLEVNQTARLDMRLAVGEVTEQVVIQDAPPVLQSENANVGQVITGRTTENLPLNGRSFQQLTLLVPGTVTPNTNSFSSLSPGAFGGRPYVNGNREQSNAFLVDGVSVDETIDNRIGYKPNVDAIQEFKVETSNSSAEFGNVAGAVVNVTIKSGTNGFHGNVFEFFRNDALDANLWVNNRNNAAKQKLRQNIFGGTFGGPIVKDRAFFFVAYQGAVHKSGGGILRTVAPAAWRLGDFSSVATPIKDPVTGLPFPGNQIPTSRFSAAA